MVMSKSRILKVSSGVLRCSSFRLMSSLYQQSNSWSSGRFGARVIFSPATALMVVSPFCAVPLMTVTVCRVLYIAFRVTLPLGTLRVKLSAPFCSSVNAQPSGPSASQWSKTCSSGSYTALISTSCSRRASVIVVLSFTVPPFTVMVRYFMYFAVTVTLVFLGIVKDWRSALVRSSCFATSSLSTVQPMNSQPSRPAASR